METLFIQKKPSRMSAWWDSLSLEQATLLYLFLFTGVIFGTYLLVYQVSEWYCDPTTDLFLLVIIFQPVILVITRFYAIKRHTAEGNIEISLKGSVKGLLWFISAFFMTSLPMLFLGGNVSGTTLFIGEYLSLIVYYLTTKEELWKQN